MLLQNALPDVLCVLQVALEGAVSKKAALNSLAQGNLPQVSPCPLLESDPNQLVLNTSTSAFLLPLCPGSFASLRHLAQSLLSSVAFVCSYPCSVRYHASVLFSSLHVKLADMQRRAEHDVVMPLPAAGISIQRPSLCASQHDICHTKSTSRNHHLQPVGGRLVSKGDVEFVGRLDTLDNRAAVSGSRLPFTVRRSHCAHSRASRPEQGRVGFTLPPSPGLHPSVL